MKCFLTLLVLCSIVHGSELFGLFKSDFKNKFTSGEHLHQECEIILAKQSSKDSFILQLSESCGDSCHGQLEEAFTATHYQYVNLKYVLITYRYLRDVKAIISKVDGNIVDTIYPLLPVMKIDGYLEKIMKACGKQPELLKMTLHIAPTSCAEFSHFISSFTASIKDTMTLHSSLQMDLSGFQPMKERLISMTLPCGVAEEIVTGLTSHPEVLFVEKKTDLPRSNNYWSRGVLQTGDYTLRRMNTAGLLGDDQIIGIADTGVDGYNGYFYDNQSSIGISHRKIIYYNSTYGDNVESCTAGHGTHVCSIAAGSAIDTNGEYTHFNGVAENAKIAFYDIQRGCPTSDPESPNSLPSNYADILNTLYKQGARIFSNSWGSMIQGFYDTHANEIDNFIYTHPDVIVLFAAGNNGSMNGAETCPSSSITTCVASPALGKNVVAVGNSLNDDSALNSQAGGFIVPGTSIDSLHYTSSRGSYVSRIKPDITAPGTWISAAQSIAGASTYHNDISWKFGTSMSTPAAAGAAAIVRQYFMDGHYSPTGVADKALYGFTPSGALIKAMLINSAQPLTAIFRDSGGFPPYFSPIGFSSYSLFQQGYGRIQISSVLNNGSSNVDAGYYNGEKTISLLSLFVVGDLNVTSPAYKVMRTKGEVHSYRITATTTQLRVTLCYYDMVASRLSSQGDSLIIRISIRVTDLSLGVVFFPSASTSKNNVQVINLGSSTSPISIGHNYTIQVSGDVIPSPQPYALVISAVVSQFASTSINPDPIIKSNKSLADVPFYPAIITLACIAAVLFFVNVPLWFTYFTKHPPTCCHSKIKI